MARRKPSDPEPTLFPFLSVLAAVIGTLILIISGMSQIALANPKQDIEVDAWDPSRKSPIYVECRAEGLLVYGEDPVGTAPVRVTRQAIVDPGGAWSALLHRLEHDPSHYLLLLVRRDGVGSFQAARDTVSRTGIDLGYEPLFGKGDVRFQPRRRR